MKTLSALFLASLLFVAPMASAGDKPNIVLINVDDLGWTDLACFGSEFYETPHIDKLASDGMKFTDAYAACAVCSPTRAAIMTGIRRPEHVTAHPLRGLLFENWATTELLKAQTNRGVKPSLYFLRDKGGHEIDAIIQTGPKTMHAVEIKSGETVASGFFGGLKFWNEKLVDYALTPWLVYGGIARQQRQAATVIPWNDPMLLRRIMRWVDKVSRGKEDVRYSNYAKAEFVEGGTVGPVSDGWTI